MSAYRKFKPGDYIKLNVGGKKFLTSYSTLTKYESLLQTMIMGGIPVSMDSKDHIIIDRDGKYFNLILNFMRDGEIDIPEDKYILKLVQREAEFYNLQELLNYINRQQNISTAIDVVEKIVGDVISALNKPNIHKNVFCDVCTRNPIIGIRYKCFECFNYDLCASCEGGNNHRHHIMLRLGTPIGLTHFIYEKATRKLAIESTKRFLSYKCDECGSSITTIRYTCLECKCDLFGDREDSYDLCGNCEKRGLHGLHPLIRIKIPKFADIYSHSPWLYVKRQSWSSDD